jgi:hypothetical protein
MISPYDSPIFHTPNSSVHIIPSSYDSSIFHIFNSSGQKVVEALNLPARNLRDLDSLFDGTVDSWSLGGECLLSILIIWVCDVSLWI